MVHLSISFDFARLEKQARETTVQIYAKFKRRSQSQFQMELETVKAYNP